MRSISKLLCLSVSLLAVPALAQTIDGGQGITGCSNDTDCGDICGWVCSFDVTPHTCVPAVSQAQAGQAATEGWCTSNAGCACAGQTCVGVYCSPAAFPGNGSTPQCVCDSDCPSGQHCDSTLEMCAPTVTSCNYDGECGCWCTCANGTCGDCTGAVATSCKVDSDCAPACAGYSCVGGTCVHDEAACINQGGTSSSSSSGSISTSSSSGSSTTVSSSSGSSTSVSSSSSGSSTSPASSSSSGSSTSGACEQVGTACSGSSDCCNDYCKNGVCTCNKATNPGTYPCLSQTDCCSGTCTGGLCVGGAASTSSAASSSASSSAASSSSSSSSSGGSSSSSKSGGGGCSTGAGGTASLALLALGLVALARRKRV